MSDNTLNVYHLADSGKLLKRYVAEAWPGYSHGLRRFRQSGTRKWVQIHGGGITIVEEVSGSVTSSLKFKSLIEVSVSNNEGALVAVYRTNAWPGYCEGMLEFKRTDNGLWVQIFGTGCTLVEEVNVDAPLRAERQGILSLT